MPQFLLNVGTLINRYASGSGPANGSGIALEPSKNNEDFLLLEDGCFILLET